MSINIKPSHRGEFTAKARAAGMSVQAYAAQVLADPNADPATRKQANFARNARGFSHKRHAARRALKYAPRA